MGFHRPSAVLLCLLCAGLVSVNIGGCRGDLPPAGEFRCFPPTLCALCPCVVYVHYVAVSIPVVALNSVYLVVLWSSRYHNCRSINDSGDPVINLVGPFVCVLANFKTCGK